MHRPAQQAPPTGVAIIGCGYWGMNYVRVISELGDAKVIMLLENAPFPRDTRVRLEAEALIEAGYGVTVIAPG